MHDITLRARDLPPTRTRRAAVGPDTPLRGEQREENRGEEGTHWAEDTDLRQGGANGPQSLQRGGDKQDRQE